MRMNRVITRRAAVIAGLGFIAAAPVAALADTVTRLGYKADGSAYEGLVTVHGKTYLYEGGAKFCGGVREYRGSRYFHEDDGRMAVDEDVEWPDGTKHHYGVDGVLSDKPKTEALDADSLVAGWYTLTCKAGGVLGASEAATANGTDVKVSDSFAADGQKWHIEWDASMGAFCVRTCAVVMEPRDYSHVKDGSAVQLWCQATKSDGSFYPHQRWRIERDADGWVTLVNADSGLALTAVTGACAELREDVASDEQKWRLDACELTHGWWQSAEGWHYNHANGYCATGWYLYDGNWYYLRDNGIMVTGVRNGYYFDGSGHWVAKNEAVATNSENGVTNAAWDFTDWAFVEEARAAAAADGSNTSYYVYVKWCDPCREVVLRRDADSGKWIAIGGWYVAVGRRRWNDWVPRGCAGTFTISQRWWNSDTGPGRCMDYIEFYKGGTPSAWGNDSASFHGNSGDTLGEYPGKWGYTTHSCIALTNARAEWMYSNIPLGTRMRNVGEMYGYDNGGDDNLRPAECYDIAIANPFA